MMKRDEDLDKVVMEMKGERGREVREMMEEKMEGNLGKKINVVEKGDERKMMRRIEKNKEKEIEEYLRDIGKNVMLIVD